MSVSRAGSRTTGRVGSGSSSRRPARARRRSWLDASGVHVRAFPTQKGLLGDGTVSFRAAIEGDGPPGDGEVVLGCLTSRLTYNIAIDAIGDAGGALAVKQITAP